TPDPQIRSLMLYPAELWVRGDAQIEALGRLGKPLFCTFRDRVSRHCTQAQLLPRHIRSSDIERMPI
ncbi:MAG: hypothetical protein V4512_07890, partial [Pseudomonadota bacterium]